MTLKTAIFLSVLVQTLAACSASSEPDRCVTVDIGESNYQHSPKYEVCLPDKALHNRPDASQNKIEVVNGYDGNWMTSGVYEISVYRDNILPQTTEKTQQEFVSLMGMREIASGDRKIFYRQKNRIFDKLPDAAKKESFGISVFEARDDGRLISIEAAIKKPKGFDKDPVGSMDLLIKKDVGALLDHIKVLTPPTAKQPK